VAKAEMTFERLKEDVRNGVMDLLVHVGDISAFDLTLIDLIHPLESPPAPQPLTPP
jgi:hypothetical protein